MASGAPSFAQNVQAWENNEAAKINQSISMGLVNPSQAQGLTTREMQIQQRTQQWAMQNGGYLSSGQQNRLADDLKELDRRLNNDINRNRNSMGNYGYNNGYNNGLVGTAVGVPVAPVVGVPYNGYTGYNGYNSGGLLGGLFNHGIGSNLLGGVLPVSTPVPVASPVAMPTPVSYATTPPFSGFSGYNHHHSNGTNPYSGLTGFH
jgi:hypothetical protein